jgi:electron transport complex protein RnfG
LTGVGVDKKLLGVRVIAHKETPGLGDKIELKKSNWIKQFKGLFLSNANKNQWKVKQDESDKQRFYFFSWRGKYR